jgi:hypothetical protein
LTRRGGFFFAQPGCSTVAMNSLQTLQSLGISLPSPAYIFGVVLFGLIGIALYRHAKRAGRRRSKWLASTGTVCAKPMQPSVIDTPGAQRNPGLQVLPARRPRPRSWARACRRAG